MEVDDSESPRQNATAVSRPTPPNPVTVAIGASAGGVEALEQLFSVMPDEMEMAFVVVQHLSPDYETLMPEILGRKTGMRVTKIQHGMLIEPNQVYVLSNGEVALVDGNRFVVEAVDRQRHSRPIDLFLSSLAKSFQANAVGVVLSGTGSDGANGVRAIHEHDGLVIVQSEASSKFNGMPRAAIGTGIVDAIVPVEEIPETLKQFVDILSVQGRSRQSVFAESMNAEQRVHKLLRNKFGIDFEQYKPGLVRRRVARRVSLSESADLDRYLQLLETDEAALTALYQDLLIGVTEFFRDPQAFMELQLRVLPRLIEAAKETGTLRVWVAPCATGEEAYTVAILIDELLSQRELDLEVKIFATDVNRDCVDFAAKGVFPGDRLANVNDERTTKYFIEEDNGFRVIPRLRKQIVFATHDLLKDAPFTKLHLVCCRNLLIYFKAEAKKKALSLFNFSLHDSGALFLGPGESTSELDSAFQMVDSQWQIYRKAFSVKLSKVGMTLGTTRKTDVATPDSESSRGQQMLPTYDAILADYMPPGILINEQNELLHVFGDASEFIRFSIGRPSNDMLELLPPQFTIAISNGLRRVKIEDRPVVYSGLELERDGTKSLFQVTVKRVSTPLQSNYLITFEEFVDKPTTQEPTSLNLESNDVIFTLEKELKETRDSLHDMILKLKSSNEDMQSTNEELIAANEELQSTNEELHSVNEELYTVNAEYQSKITELTELTDDMDNLLDSLHVDTVFLDQELRVRKFTLGATDTFKFMPHDIGREFASFNHDLKFDDLVGRVRQVLSEEGPFETDVQDASGNWFLMRILPYSAHGQTEGVLLTLIGISDIKKTEQRLAELSDIVQSSDDAIFRLSVEGEIRTWNRGAQSMFRYESHQVIGKHVEMLGLDEQADGAISKTLERISHGESVDHLELIANRRDGESFAVALTVSPILNSEKCLDGASVVMRDITVQQARNQFHDEQVKLRDHFLAVLSHELRNPTAAIVNASALLARDDIDENQKNNANEIVFRHSQQLAKMMDDLLHVARVTHNKITLDRQPFDLVIATSHMLECVESRIQEKQQILELELPTQPLFISADQTRIIQAQTNLLVNASKYTQVGGEIVFSVTREGNEVVISVRDQGEGMTQELQERIFEVFVQADRTLDRKNGGMGLGLPLVKMIAEAHGGTITATSDGLGCGSTFQLRLPCEEVAGQEMTESPEALIPKPHCFGTGEVEGRQNPMAGVKVLLIEDNDGAREMLASFLELDGVIVETASNGIEGVDQIRNFEPKICIVDIGLPDMNGFQVAQKAREIESSLLLVALTGYGQESDRQKVKDAGFDLHLIKPIDPENILTQIASILSVKSPVRQ